ncbi:Rad2 nuclease [Marasmius crinis-equi]|uniref:Rad2 nuclease n=1 Tax=Marasmius crinis-equi TaxID=585013 RepID=A0ABR3F8A9_9AGAR
MGVKGFFNECKAAAEVCTLKEYAVKHGYETNNRNWRSLVLGVDANNLLDMCRGASKALQVKSIHSASALEIFFKTLCLLSAAPVSLLFVFDGPNRPKIKRGVKVITDNDPVLYRQALKFIRAFSYRSTMAPGEADCLLAALAKNKVIDGVISDDSDMIFLGIPLVFRKLRGPNSKDIRYQVYTPKSVQDATGLTRGGLVLTALLSGSDHDDGVDGCGIKTAIDIAKNTALGEELLEYASLYAETPDYLDESLDAWRNSLRLQISFNPRGKLNKHYPTISERITARFPDRKALRFYVNYPPPVPGTLPSMEPRLLAISTVVSACREMFKWTDNHMLRRFKGSGIWEGALLRLLYSPRLYYDKPSHSFHEGVFQAGFVKTSPKHQFRGGLRCARVTFCMETLTALSDLEVPRGTSMKRAVWVPLSVFQVAKASKPLPSQQPAVNEPGANYIDIDSDSEEEDAGYVESPHYKVDFGILYVVH